MVKSKSSTKRALKKMESLMFVVMTKNWVRLSMAEAERSISFPWNFLLMKQSRRSGEIKKEERINDSVIKTEK